MEQIETQVSDLRYLTQEHPGGEIASSAVHPGTGRAVSRAASATVMPADGGSALHQHHPPHQPTRQPSTPVTPGGTSFRNINDNDGSESGAAGGSSNKRKAEDEETGGAGKGLRNKRNRVSSSPIGLCGLEEPWLDW